MDREAVAEVDDVAGRPCGEGPGVVAVQHHVAFGVAQAGLEGDVVGCRGHQDVVGAKLDGVAPFVGVPREGAGGRRLHDEAGFDALVVHRDRKRDLDSGAQPHIGGTRRRRDPGDGRRLGAQPCAEPGRSNGEGDEHGQE